MASGDVVLQVTNMPVVEDSSDNSTGTPTQQTKLGAGTPVTPSSGLLTQAVTIGLVRSYPDVVGLALFDSTKRYKLTIEEV